MTTTATTPVRPDRTHSVKKLTQSRWYPVVLFLGVAVVLYTVVAVAGHLGRSQVGGVTLSSETWDGPFFLEGWARYDAGWYRSIADRGYFWDPNAQSSVAFFPAYPMSMGFLGDVFGGEVFVWGTLITFASGFLVVVLFHTWCRDRLGPAATPTAVAVLVLWPYAWYLFGAVYADALFLAAVLLAFVFLERDKVWLAALAGAVATATRPVGAAVLIGLIIRLLERRGAFRFPVPDFRRLRRGDPVILLAATGLLAYVVYLWRTFDEPFAFAEAESAPGWDQRPGPKTWIKTAWMSRVVHMPETATPYLANISFQAVLSIGLLLLVPLVVKRLGWGYGAYTFIVLIIPLVGSKDFMGLGRYALTAFPSFAVLGLVLYERPRLRIGWLAISGMLLVFYTGAFAYGKYVA